MPHRHNPLTLRDLLSPYGLAAISSVVFVVAWIFPPSLYERLMDERDLMFLDPLLALFYFLCVGAFVLGAFLIDGYAPAGPCIDRRLRSGISPAVFVLVPLLASLCVSIMSIVSVLRNGVLLPLLLSGEGGAVKESVGAEGTLMSSLVLTGMCLAGVIWWATWRSKELRLGGTSGRLVRMALYVAVLCVVISASLKLDRTALLPYVIGLVVITLIRRSVTTELPIRAAWRPALCLFLCTVIVFVFFSSLRGADTSEKIGGAALVYTISSYNRMSALLSGTLRYTYGGRGLYLSGFLAFNNSLNAIIPIRKVMDWPNYYDVWRSEFSSVWRANLNGNSNWCGAFGFIYSDLGWCSPFFVFMYGLLCGFMWRSVRLGDITGVVLYPWCAFCILFWFGFNLLLWTQCSVLVIDAIALSGYELFLLTHPKHVSVCARGRADCRK